MRIGIVLLMSLLFVWAPSLFGQPRTVPECGDRHAITDIPLQQAVTQAGIASVEFQTEDFPCAHNKYVSKAFLRTFGIEVFRLASGHSFLLVKNGANRFSIDVFAFETKQAAEAVEKTIRRRKIHNLQIESLTYYDFFVNGKNLVFFIADRRTFNESRALFKRINDQLLTEPAHEIDSPASR